MKVVLLVQTQVAVTKQVERVDTPVETASTVSVVGGGQMSGWFYWERGLMDRLYWETGAGLVALGLEAARALTCRSSLACRRPLMWRCWCGGIPAS